MSASQQAGQHELHDIGLASQDRVEPIAQAFDVSQIVGVLREWERFPV